MGADRYKIVLTGFKPEAKTTEVKLNLAELLDLSPNRLEYMLSGMPAKLIDDIDLKTAIKYQDAINDAGGVCKLEPSADTASKVSQQREKKVLKTCGNCGYNAVSPNDPLITAFDNRGECPSCGSIPDKKIVHKSSVAQEKQCQKASQKQIEHRTNDEPSMRKPLIISAAVVLLILAIHFLIRSPKTDEPQNRSAELAKTEQNIIREKPQRSPGNVILPGQTKRGIISFYLPYLHRDSYFPLSITATHSSKNPWEEEGVIVEILSSTVKTETLTLWERYDSRISEYVPDTGVRIVSRGSRDGIAKGNNLLVCSYPDKIVNDAKNTAENDDKKTDRYRNNYIMYSVEIVLSISVPEGEEFGTRELTSLLKDGRTVPRAYHEKSFDLSTSYGIEIDSNYESMTGEYIETSPGGWRPASLSSFSDNNLARLVMTHMTNKEGLYITVGDTNNPCRFTMLDD